MPKPFVCLYAYLKYTVLFGNSPLKNDHLKYMNSEDVAIAGEGLQNFRPIFGAQGHRAGRDLYRARPSLTQGFSFSGLIRKTAPFSHLSDTQRGVEDKF